VDNLVLLTPISKRTMWLARKAELETRHDEFEVLQEMERVLTKFFSPPVSWSDFMSFDVAIRGAYGRMTSYPLRSCGG
jgi:hypothetical protein